MLSDFAKRPAFETIRPKHQTNPFVFNSAHSGTDYPQRFLEMTRLDKRTIRQSEDSYVDQIFEQAPFMGSPLLSAKFPRAYLDVNREPYELDPLMFKDKLPKNYNTTSPRVSAGLGTIARIVAENKNIYRDKLSLTDAHMRIQGIYHPYHKTLQKLISQSVDQFGVAVLIDCHSMPQLSSDRKIPAPQIILGDRFGTTCAPSLIDLAERFFADAGLIVARNRPYAGGHIAQTYGKPHHAIHALQIEISRSLYMNETTRQTHEGFNVIKTVITQLIKGFVALDLNLLTTSKIAAQ